MNVPLPLPSSFATNIIAPSVLRSVFTTYRPYFFAKSTTFSQPYSGHSTIRPRCVPSHCSNFMAVTPFGNSLMTVLITSTTRFICELKGLEGAECYLSTAKGWLVPLNSTVTSDIVAKRSLSLAKPSSFRSRLEFISLLR